MNNPLLPAGETYPVMDQKNFPLMRWSQARWYQRLGYHLVYNLTRLIPGLGPLLRWTLIVEAHHHGWHVAPPAPSATAADPVQFLALWDGAEEDAKLAGYTAPGWYFWEETWAHCQGPFESKDEASMACKHYAEKML